jgi:hypothetical protein
VGVVAKTYKTAPKELLKEILNVSDIEAVAKSHDWKVVDATVQIPTDQSAQAKAKAAASSDPLRFERSFLKNF